MIIRPASVADLESIMVIEQRGFDPAEQWSSPSWNAELTGTDRSVLVAEDHQAVIGVISIQVLAPSSDLLRVVVEPEAQRQGIASRLIDGALDAAAERGARTMLLEVRFDNEAAIACYGRAGFEQLTTRADYYGRGRHALIMKRYELDERRPSSGAGAHPGPRDLGGRA